MYSKTNQLAQKSHQRSDDDLHWLRCKLFQDFHHFGRLKVGQILAGPHMTFHPLWNVNTTRKLESYLKLLPWRDPPVITRMWVSVCVCVCVCIRMMWRNWLSSQNFTLLEDLTKLVAVQLHVCRIQKMNYILSHKGNVNQIPAYFDMLSNLNCQWHRGKICDDWNTRLWKDVSHAGSISR